MYHVFGRIIKILTQFMTRLLKKDKENIDSFVGNHLRHILFCSKTGMDFILSYKSSDIADENEKKDFTGRSPSFMTIDIDYKYLTADLIYNQERIEESWKDKNYLGIVNTLCHEVSHIITGEPFETLKIKYKGASEELQERLTERVGRILYRLYINFMTENKINVKTGHINKR